MSFLSWKIKPTQIIVLQNYYNSGMILSSTEYEGKMSCHLLEGCYFILNTSD